MNWNEELKNLGEHRAVADCEPSRQITHRVLVDQAAIWLRKKCEVVVTELATMGEEPDALGWNGWTSTLVECKASRSDFLNDRNKSFRTKGDGMGVYRYYLSTPGIIKVEDLPGKWGLLELTAKRIRVVQKAEPLEANRLREILILLSALRRIGQNCPLGMSVRCYTMNTGNRATLGVLPVLKVK